jgi:hypothetical protein
MSSQPDDKRPALSPAETLKAEAEAERRQAELVAEALKNAGDRCPECGSLGSLEQIDGKLKCIDCDFDLMARHQLSGMGRA